MAKYDKHFKIRTDSDMKNRLRDMANDRSELSGKKVSVSSVIRSILRSRMDNQAPLDIDALHESMNEAHKIHLGMRDLGRELNAITHQFNSGNGLPRDQLELLHRGMREQLEGITDILKEVRETLDRKATDDSKSAIWPPERDSERI